MNHFLKVLKIAGLFYLVVFALCVILALFTSINGARQCHGQNQVGGQPTRTAPPHKC
jgi:hypothetical protein